MKQIWQLPGGSAILLIGCFLSQDMCLWPAPAILHLPSILVLFGGTFFIFAFLAAVPFGFYLIIRSVCRWPWQDRPAAVSDFLLAVVCLLFAIGYVGISIWGSTRRTAAFARASANSAPIIAALKQYQADHGNYPNSLRGLTPRIRDFYSSHGADWLSGIHVAQWAQCHYGSP